MLFVFYKYRNLQKFLTFMIKKIQSSLKEYIIKFYLIFFVIVLKFVFFFFKVKYLSEVFIILFII